MESEEEWEIVSPKNSPEPENDENSLEISIPNSISNVQNHSNPKRKSITKSDRLIRQDCHKTHLLCLLSSGSWMNKSCNCILYALALSLFPVDLKILVKFNTFKAKLGWILDWFCSIESHLSTIFKDWKEMLFETYSDFKHALFIAACRSTGLKTRLIASLSPISLSMASDNHIKKKPRIVSNCIQIWAEVLDSDKNWIPIRIGFQSTHQINPH